ncbi:hypothetical protein BJY04DRAFT_42373 [Aspergillus karnatakaensis]|uniref:bZIP transcription factor JlbA/IDI-4 n=1 Tax=Aspergillus karnatakaensis TaxID=1810916 RepID=UPI003CCD759B
MFPGDPISSTDSFDYNTLTTTAFPTSQLITTADPIDWAALGCWPTSQGLGEHPANTLENQSQASIPSAGSPDPPFDHSNTNKQSHHPTPLTTTISPQPTKKSSPAYLMPSATTTLPTPSPASRESSPKETPSRVSKRQLNTMAARRYRQRRLDRMTQLEEELEAVKRERDELRMKVSKLEGETDALKSMLKEKSN